jgi:hypothetical protein
MDGEAGWDGSKQCVVERGVRMKVKENHTAPSSLYNERHTAQGEAGGGRERARA